MAAEPGTAADGGPAAVRSPVVPSEVGSRSTPPLRAGRTRSSRPMPLRGMA